MNLTQGERATIAVKLDADKIRLDLLSAVAIEELGRVLTFGAKKYTDHNWRNGLQWTRVIAASARHLFAIVRGEDLDAETGYAHAAHLQACAMFLTEFTLLKNGLDDRYRPGKRGGPDSAV